MQQDNFQLNSSIFQKVYKRRIALRAGTLCCTEVKPIIGTKHGSTENLTRLESSNQAWGNAVNFSDQSGNFSFHTSYITYEAAH